MQILKTLFQKIEQLQHDKIITNFESKISSWFNNKELKDLLFQYHFKDKDQDISDWDKKNYHLIQSNRHIMHSLLKETIGEKLVEDWNTISHDAVIKFDNYKIEVTQNKTEDIISIFKNDEIVFLSNKIDSLNITEKQYITTRLKLFSNRFSKIQQKMKNKNMTNYKHIYNLDIIEATFFNEHLQNVSANNLNSNVDATRHDIHPTYSAYDLSVIFKLPHSKNLREKIKKENQAVDYRNIITHFIVQDKNYDFQAFLKALPEEELKTFLSNFMEVVQKTPSVSGFSYSKIGLESLDNFINSKAIKNIDTYIYNVFSLQKFQNLFKNNTYSTEEIDINLFREYNNNRLEFYIKPLILKYYNDEQLTEYILNNTDIPEYDLSKLAKTHKSLNIFDVTGDAYVVPIETLKRLIENNSISLVKNYQLLKTLENLANYEGTVNKKEIVEFIDKYIYHEHEQVLSDIKNLPLSTRPHKKI